MKERKIIEWSDNKHLETQKSLLAMESCTPTLPSKPVTERGKRRAVRRASKKE